MQVELKNELEKLEEVLSRYADAKTSYDEVADMGVQDVLRGKAILFHDEAIDFFTKGLQAELKIRHNIEMNALSDAIVQAENVSATYHMTKIDQKQEN